MNADYSLFFCNFATESRRYSTRKMSARTYYLISISKNSVYMPNTQPQPEIKKCTLKMYPMHDENNAND